MCWPLFIIIYMYLRVRRYVHLHTCVYRAMHTWVCTAQYTPAHLRLMHRYTLYAIYPSHVRVRQCMHLHTCVYPCVCTYTPACTPVYAPTHVRVRRCMHLCVQYRSCLPTPYQAFLVIIDSRYIGWQDLSSRPWELANLLLLFNLFHTNKQQKKQICIYANFS